MIAATPIKLVDLAAIFDAEVSPDSPYSHTLANPLTMNGPRKAEMPAVSNPQELTTRKTKPLSAIFDEENSGIVTFSASEPAREVHQFRICKRFLSLNYV